MIGERERERRGGVYTILQENWPTSYDSPPPLPSRSMIIIIIIWYIILVNIILL